MNPFDDRFGPHRGAYHAANSNVRRYRVVDGLSQDNSFEEASELVYGDNLDTHTMDSYSLHNLPCGHVIGAPQELGGHCEKCHQPFCFQCTSRCGRCLAVACPGCLRVRDGLPFCKRCRTLRLVKLCFLSVFQGLHHILSKEF